MSARQTRIAEGTKQYPEIHPAADARPLKIASSFWPRFFHVLIAAALIALALLFAEQRITTKFMPYDDEGYVLLSLQHFFAGGSLYTDTYSQYGPVYFYLQQVIFWTLHLPVTHDAGRLVTTLYWISASTFSASFVFKISRNLLFAAAAFLSCTVLSAVLADEPNHPQQLVLLLCMLAAWLSSMRTGRPAGRTLLALGAIGAALCFTKINTGVFYFVAIAQTLLCLLPRGRTRNIALGVVFLSAAIAPLLLMHANLGTWAAGYCAIAIFCLSGTFLFGSLLNPSVTLAVRTLLFPVAGFLLVSFAVLIRSELAGMSLSTLLQGVVLGPLSQPQIFSMPLVVPLSQVVGGVVIISAITAVLLLRTKRGTHETRIRALSFAFGLCVVVVFLCSARIDLTHHELSQRFAWLMLLFPLTLVPLLSGHSDRSYLFPRLFIANLAATQFLQAYPVAGSQVSISAMPLLLWAFVCIHDGVSSARDLLDEASRVLIAQYPRLAFSSAFIVLAALFGMWRMGFRFDNHRDPSSGLKGSALLHLRPKQAECYRFLSQEIADHCSLLFSLPGLGSLNLWSGVPTPNGSNLTGWTKAFSKERQSEILTILQANPRACAVYNPELAGFWGSTPTELASLPLARYIIFTMPKIAEKDGYQLRVHP